MNKTAIAVLLLVSAPRVACAAADAGLPGAYLNYAGGAEVSGMGRAYVGLADGIDAVAWNPAGLALLRPNTVGFLHTQTVQQAALDYIGYSQPIYRVGGVGLGYVRLDSGGLPQTNEFNQEVGSFHDVQQTLMAGFGFKPVSALALGGTFKFSQQKLAGASASGWGADLGGLYMLPHGLRVGLRVQNAIAPSFKYETATDQFPRVATLGLAAKVLEDRLALTWDIDKSLGVTQAIQWRLGAEATFWRIAKLRAGFDFQQKEFTFGLGYLWGRSSFDYSSSSNQDGLAHRFGMSRSFGGYDVSLAANPKVFSPMGLVKKTTLAIQIEHSRPLHEWVLQIKNQGKDLVHTIRGSGHPPAELTWDGKTGYGMAVAPGIYTCTLSVTDVDGRTETTPPAVVRVEYGTPLDTLELSTR